MTKKQRLQNLLKVFTPDETAIDFTSFESEMKKLETSLKEKVQATTLSDVNSVLEKQSKKINFEPLTQAFDSLKQDFADKNLQLLNTLNEKQTQLTESILQSNTQASQGNETLKQEIDQLTAEVAILEARKIEIPDFGKQIKDAETKLMAMIQTAKDMDALEDEKEKELLQVQFANFEKQIRELKQQVLNRGGAMHRKITFNGTDYLTRYTDINYKAGSNVTFTVANNNQTKMVDVTISATGGGGGGTVRSINSISTDTTAAAASQTDYVYLCTGTLTLTLPDATAGNTNLYTVKNVGTGVVTVATTSSQTIDGDLTKIMPVQYTSIDVISDTANWGIT